MKLPSSDLYPIISWIINKKDINNKDSLVYIKAKGNDNVEYQTTIFLVMIGGFIAVTIMMQILGRGLPQD